MKKIVTIATYVLLFAAVTIWTVNGTSWFIKANAVVDAAPAATIAPVK